MGDSVIIVIFLEKKRCEFRSGILLKMAGSIHEGPEFGVGDFVLLHDLTLDAFMENLKLR